MKLAEALSLRKDLEKKISGLKERLENVVKVQEGDEPVESPEELMKELDNCLVQLELLIYNINMSNMKVVDEDGKSMTKLLAERDILNKRITILRSAFERASKPVDRYSCNEIRMLTKIDVKSLRRQIDKYSQQYRQLDYGIQIMNFKYDLVE
jgi:uncharacterized coiled-coil DUF342 family protein